MLSLVAVDDRRLAVESTNYTASAVDYSIIQEVTFGKKNYNLSISLLVSC
jgi:hypothetical protein